MFDAKKFTSDFHIDTPKGGKHQRAGWINIPCPMCAGNPGYHGGFNTADAYYNCYRCGNHWIPKVVSALLKVPIRNAVNITAKYLTGEQRKKYVKKQYADKLKFPPTTTSDLPQRHRDYLMDRHYDPAQLARLWDLKATQHIGNYKFRIVAPIYLDGRLISYQARDITGAHSAKYMACAEQNEVFHHKFSLYGIDNVTNGRAICVEGITDAWRFGHGAVATFGIEFTMPQVALLSKRITRLFIFFDDDPQAQQKAEQLGTMLSVFGINTEILSDDTVQDPAQLTQSAADYILKTLKIKKR